MTRKYKGPDSLARAFGKRNFDGLRKLVFATYKNKIWVQAERIPDEYTGEYVRWGVRVAKTSNDRLKLKVVEKNGAPYNGPIPKTIRVHFEVVNDLFDDWGVTRMTHSSYHHWYGYERPDGSKDFTTELYEQYPVPAHYRIKIGDFAESVIRRVELPCTKQVFEDTLRKVSEYVQRRYY